MVKKRIIYNIYITQIKPDLSNFVKTINFIV